MHGADGEIGRRYLAFLQAFHQIIGRHPLNIFNLKIHVEIIGKWRVGKAFVPPFRVKAF